MNLACVIPQNLSKPASPEFVGLTLSGLDAEAGVYTDLLKGLTSTPPSSGVLGYWDRTGTVLSPATSGDDITTTGVATANEFVLEKPTGSYIFTSRDSVNNKMVIQQDDVAQTQMSVEFYAALNAQSESPGTAWIQNQFYARGSKSDRTNISNLAIGYSPTRTQYELYTFSNASVGTLTTYDLAIYTFGNPTQLFLDKGGDIEMGAGNVDITAGDLTLTSGDLSLNSVASVITVASDTTLSQYKLELNGDGRHIEYDNPYLKLFNDGGIRFYPSGIANHFIETSISQDANNYHYIGMTDNTELLRLDGDLLVIGGDNDSGLQVTGGNIRAITTKTTTYQVLDTDYTILGNHATTAFTITLLASPETGRIYNIKNINAADVTVSGGAETIDGSGTVALAEDESITVQYNGTEWSII